MIDLNLTEMMKLAKDYDNQVQKNLLYLRNYYSEVEDQYSTYQFMLEKRVVISTPFTVTNLIYRIIDCAEGIKSATNRLSLLPTDSNPNRFQRYYFFLISNYPNEFRHVLGGSVNVYVSKYQLLVKNSTIKILAAFCLEILLISSTIIFLLVSFRKIHNRMIKVLKIFSQLTEDEAKELLSFCQVYHNQLVFESKTNNMQEQMKEDSYSESEDSQLLVQNPQMISGLSKKRLVKTNFKNPQNSDANNKKKTAGINSLIPIKIFKEEKNEVINNKEVGDNKSNQREEERNLISSQLVDQNQKQENEEEKKQSIHNTGTFNKIHTLKVSQENENELGYKMSHLSNNEMDRSFQPSISFVSVREESLVEVEQKVSNRGIRITPINTEHKKEGDQSILKDERGKSRHSEPSSPAKSIERKLSLVNSLRQNKKMKSNAKDKKKDPFR